MPVVPNILPFAFGGPNLLTQDLAALGIIPPLWGIFSQFGQSVIEFDTVVAFEYRQDWVLSSYPVEEGGFRTYNKVWTPFNIRMKVATGGVFINRQAFLSSIGVFAGTLLLFDVITPEITYPSCNIVHYDYDRSAESGAGLIQVTIWLMQVQVITPAATVNTATPGGATPQAGGNVQSSFPTPPLLTKVNGFLRTLGL